MKTISQKKEAGIWILAALLLVASFCLGLGVFAFNATARIYTASEEVARNWLPSVQAIGKIRQALTQLRREGGHIIIYGSDCTAHRCEEILIERRENLATAESGYMPLVTPGEEQRLVNLYLQQRDAYLGMQESLIVRGNGERTATLEEFITRSDEAYDRVTTTLAQLADFNSEGGRRSQAVVNQHYARAQLYLYALNFLLLGLAAAFTAQIIALAGRNRH